MNLIKENEGIYVDFTRQCVTPKTVEVSQHHPETHAQGRVEETLCTLRPGPCNDTGSAQDVVNPIYAHHQVLLYDIGTCTFCACVSLESFPIRVQVSDASIHAMHAPDSVHNFVQPRVKHTTVQVLSLTGVAGSVGGSDDSSMSGLGYM